MNMDDLIPDDAQKRIQRALNEAKKRELDEKYGPAFWSEGSNLSPEAEAEWLNHIEEFERQLAHAERVSVRRFLGDPPVKLLAEIPPEALERALDALLDLLAEHSIRVDFLTEVDDAEVYRFITEELFDEEMDDIRIPGMMHCFIYEEFHPNDEYDAEMCAEDFLFNLFHRNRKSLERGVAKDEHYDADGTPISFDEMMRRVDAFLERFALITNERVEPVACAVDGDYATVETETAWEGWAADTMQPTAYAGRSILRLKRSPYGDWSVIQARIAGWHDR